MNTACESPRLTQTADALALEPDYSGTITSTPAWTSPVHDLAGNMTTIPRMSSPGTAQTTVYDAWNRLVELRQGGTVIADYKYDGRGRRIFKYTGLADESRDFYYSNAWQILEERVSGAADTQYVWGLRYVDELICRDYDNDSDGTLEQRMYALQDANFNLTAIVDTNGDPQERYIYSPYGVRSFLTPFFASRSSSSYLWSIGHQGLMHDYESGLVYNRNRMLHPKLGRFMQRDPLGYVDGVSLYEYEGDPNVLTDPGGVSTTRPTSQPEDNRTSRIYIECRSTGDDPGATKWGRAIFIGSRGAINHCSIVACCGEDKGKDTKCMRFELGKGNMKDLGNSSIDPNEYVDLTGGFGFAEIKVYRWTRWDVELISNAIRKDRWGNQSIVTDRYCGGPPCEIFECLKREFEPTNSAAPPYKPTGPNSNTFANSLLNRCGLRFKPLPGQGRPGGAIGWQDPVY